MLLGELGGAPPGLVAPFAKAPGDSKGGFAGPRRASPGRPSGPSSGGGERGVPAAPHSARASAPARSGRYSKGGGKGGGYSGGPERAAAVHHTERRARVEALLAALPANPIL